MDATQAIEIIQALADGVDPYTGEVLPDGGPYQHPQTVRALFLAVKALGRYEERQKRERNLPGNAGQAWSEAEDALLCQRFAEGMSVNQLAQEHERTAGAVQSRLVRLGKLEPYSTPVEEQKPGTTLREQ